jgi:hypothetical protein
MRVSGALGIGHSAADGLAGHRGASIVGSLALA